MLPRSRSFRAAVGLLCAGLLGVGTSTVLVDPVSAAEPAYCAGTLEGVATARWTGAGDGTDWFDDANWDTPQAPGTAGPARACLPASADVVVGYREGAVGGVTEIVALDMAPGARLGIPHDGRLLLGGDQSEVTSYVRRSAGGTAATLTLSGVLLGQGNLLVDGVLHLLRGPLNPPTMATRWCEVTLTCPGNVAVPAAGRTTVGPRGLLRMSVEGPQPDNRRGSQIEDRWLVDVRGEMRLEDPAYLAMDHGTAIVVRPNPEAVLSLAGRASIYEGRDTRDDALAVVYVQGRIAKSAAGVSLVGVDVVRASSARAVVNAGRLSIAGSVTPVAKVRQGATYGLGRCEGTTTCQSPPATTDDPATVAMTLPRTSTPARVELVERPLARTSKDLIDPIDIHVDGERTTPKKPMVFTLRLDKTAVAGRTAASLRILRGSQLIRSCRADGTPRGTAKACVSSRLRLKSGDVEVRVRSQVNSRWKIR